MHVFVCMRLFACFDMFIHHVNLIHDIPLFLVHVYKAMVQY